MTNTEIAAKYAATDALLDAERDAIVSCMAAAHAVPEVKAAREATLAGIRAELVAAGFSR